MCATMRQSSPNLDPRESNKRIGLPPSYPNNSHFFADQHHRQGGTSHLRSLSQSSIFSIDFRPMEQDNAASSQGILAPVSSRVNDGGLPPLRAAAHRRAISDTVPLGFCDMIQSSPQLVPIRGQVGGFNQLELVKQESEVSATDEMLMMSAYMHMDNVDPLNSSGTEDNKDLDSRASSTKTNGTESSDNEAESHVKGIMRSADGEIGPAGRHCRSVSMDSFMGGLRLDEESMIMKLPPMGVRVGQQHSPSSSSMQGNLSKFNLEFGNGEFTETELKKITSNDKLTELAMADPKRVKRILANRLSAARSKERKMRYIAELELKVQALQAEATTLSAQVTVLQHDSANLTSQNNELKFRLQSIEQQAQLKDVFFTTWMHTLWKQMKNGRPFVRCDAYHALNEALVAEVQRLGLAASTHHHQQQQQLPVNHPMMQPGQANTYQQQQELNQAHNSN